MNIPTITMEPEAAKAKLEAYRQQVTRRQNEEYEAALKGYEALSHGTPLINLQEVFASAGLGEDGRPRLAIARADRKQVQVNFRSWRVPQDVLRFNALKGFENNSWYWYWDETSLIIDVPFEGLPQNGQPGYALIPMVPADVRPSGQLKDYFILWEVEKWADRPLIAEPDRDPYLLQHLIGDLYAVIAEWDLTELERAIMAGRREGN